MRFSFRRLLGIFISGLVLTSAGRAQEAASITTRSPVGRLSDNRWATPTNQILTPAGIQVDLPGMRPQAIALSPDGRILVTSGKTSEVVVVEPRGGRILQKVPFPGKQPAPADVTGEAHAAQSEEKTGEPVGTQIKPDTGAQLSFTGLIFSADGTRIYVSNVNGDVKVFAVDRAHVVSPLKTISLPDSNSPKRKAEIPAGLAISETAKRLYVACNLGNRLVEIDTESGKVARTWDVGVAPYDVVLAAGKAYVSNWGGRRPGKDDLTGPAGRGTVVRVDPVRNIASEGSVTVIDLESGRVTSEIVAGLHTSALAVSPGERYVVAANASSDTLTVVDTRTDQIAEKIWTRETPAGLFSATPDALAFDRSGKRLYVCNATLNAIAVVQFDPADRASKLLGMIPVGWFPGGVAFSAATKSLCVANVKGVGSHRAMKSDDKSRKPSESGQNSKDYFGTLSLVAIPEERDLATLTRTVAINTRSGALDASRLPAREAQPPRPIPERPGEPTPLGHVIYIIKENRTYDQILGDVKTGNGEPALCTFGEKFTPNEHRIARDFVLLDNTYCSGIQSADGHQWTDSAISTDYVERGHAGWPRSYPNLKTNDAMDALAYSPAGFLWDDCLAHKVSVRNIGEACVSDCSWADKTRKGKPGWKDFYLDYLSGGHQTELHCKPGIATLASISKLDTVGWDLGVPDVLRAAKFAGELETWEAAGEMPKLVVMTLPNDHTGGNSPGRPTPAAQVADNDLALGHIVEAVSHSKFWKDTAIFAIEDDPQSGWDHVSGYRTTCYVASAYAKRGVTVHTQYNNTSVLRTIELILGLPPMNIMDATATPMSDCFTETPDSTPWVAVPNQQPLDELGPEIKKIQDPQIKKDAAMSSRLPLIEADRCPEDVLNHILWRAMKGTRVPYPEWAVTKAGDGD